MGSAERRQKHKENQRALVLETARAIARQEGWQQVSMRKIADRMEYSPAGLYEYFAGKDEIINALLKEGNLMQAHINEQIVAAEGPAIEKIKSLSLAYFRFAINHPEYFEVMYSLNGISCCMQVAGEEIKKVIAPVAAVLSQLIPAQSHTESTFMQWWAVVHGFTALFLSKRLFLAEKVVEEKLLEVIQQLYGAGRQ